MSSTVWDDHLKSPDGKWFWDGVSQEWKPLPPTTTPPPPPARTQPRSLKKGLDSFAGEVRSEDLAYGQTVLVWARWILIGTGLLLSFWGPKDLLTLQVELAAIIALAFGNFYLHVQLMRGHPAIDTVVYGASVADISVVTALVLVQHGYESPVFIFYFAAIVGISVAFPTFLTASYTAVTIGVYGIIALVTAPADGYPAVFTRLLMIAAVALCGNLFARSESRRRADAIRIHTEMLDEAEQSEGASNASLTGSARQKGGHPNVERA